MTANDLDDWTPIASGAQDSPSAPISPSQLASVSDSSADPMPTKASVFCADDQPSSANGVGFFAQHRTVEERFRILFPGTPTAKSPGEVPPSPVTETLCTSFGLLSFLGIFYSLSYLYRWTTGSEFRLSLPTSIAELVAFNATLWRWSYFIAAYSIWVLQTFLYGWTYLMAGSAYSWCLLAIGCVGGLVAFLGAILVLPPLLLIVWSVTLHEWTVLNLLPTDFISPPVAYIVDHLLLLSPILVLSLNVPSSLPPFLTHPVLLYPLLALYFASAALDCTIPEVFNYPFNRFERILAEHRRLLKDQEQRSKAEEAQRRDQ